VCVYVRVCVRVRACVSTESSRECEGNQGAGDDDGVKNIPQITAVRARMKYHTQVDYLCTPRRSTVTNVTSSPKTTVLTTHQPLALTLNPNTTLLTLTEENLYKLLPLVELELKRENSQQNALPTAISRQSTNMLHSAAINQCVPVHSHCLSIFIMSYLGCLQIKILRAGPRREGTKCTLAACCINVRKKNKKT